MNVKPNFILNSLISVNYSGDKIEIIDEICHLQFVLAMLFETSW